MDQNYIGIDLGGTNIKVSFFDQEFNKIAEKRAATEVQRGSAHVMKNMITAVQELMEESEKKSEDFICMGIGVPGLLDIERGISMFSPNFPDWKDVPVVKIMQENLQILTYIDNDARVNLYGEWYMGAGRNRKNVVLVTLGTGLGSGMVIDGKVAYGATNSAMELGHMNMYREGRPCRCGSSGCFGRYVSALGMIRTVREKIEKGGDSVIEEWTRGNPDIITARMISEAYDVNDEVAVDTMKETGELLGFGLMNVINLLNPEIIIIGGVVSNAGERLLKWTRNIIDNRALEISSAACELVTAELGDAAGMIGAAIYGKQKRERQGM